MPYGMLVAILAACAVVLIRGQQIADWVVLRNYQAPTAIAQLAVDDTMTSYAQHFFYINRPSLEGKAAFNKHCTNQTEQAVVLGCYRGNRQGIYLYDVTDTRLQGVEQVTAAHEMLHQAYDRLSTKERTHIDNLLKDYFQHQLTDQVVKDQMAAYKKTEPNDLANEMHSVFGTEIATLPAELEAYYRQYFTDRSKIITYYSGYQAEFTQRQQQVTAYDQQLAVLKSQIDAKEANLTTRQQELQQKKDELDRLRNNGSFDAYNEGVPTYNSLVSAYNTEIATTKALIAQYNALVDQRNAIAVQEQQLQQALDSRLAPAAKQ